MDARGGDPEFCGAAADLPRGDPGSVGGVQPVGVFGGRIQMAADFADHAAVAIANAEAFEELDRLKRQLEAENEYLHEEIRGTLPFGEIVGESAALRKVLEQVGAGGGNDGDGAGPGRIGHGKRTDRAGDSRAECASNAAIYQGELRGDPGAAF